jgi:hypothetical protein
MMLCPQQEELEPSHAPPRRQQVPVLAFPYSSLSISLLSETFEFKKQPLNQLLTRESMAYALEAMKAVTSFSKSGDKSPGQTSAILPAEVTAVTVGVPLMFKAAKDTCRTSDISRPSPAKYSRVSASGPFAMAPPLLRSNTSDPATGCSTRWCP